MDEIENCLRVKKKCSEQDQILWEPYIQLLEQKSLVSENTSQIVQVYLECLTNHKMNHTKYLLKFFHRIISMIKWIFFIII